MSRRIKRFGNSTRCKTLRHDYKEAWEAADKDTYDDLWSSLCEAD